jgi:hypothetical protein
MLHLSKVDYSHLWATIVILTTKVTHGLTVVREKPSNPSSIPAVVKVDGPNSRRVTFTFREKPSGDILVRIEDGYVSGPPQKQPWINLQIKDIYALGPCWVFDQHAQRVLWLNFKSGQFSAPQSTTPQLLDAEGEVDDSPVECSGCGKTVSPGNCRSCTARMLSSENPNRMLASRLKLEYDALNSDPPQVDPDIINQRLKTIRESGKLTL